MAIGAGMQVRLRELPQQLEGYMYEVSTSDQKNV
jgi:hypothetical protein